ncbi:expressed unknown protein [Seminavis robusta]|uniref:Uncharacterized protein n=1 Tax=Seminavis robusta TaxID=568900 RepID=A0A9N8H288_9STRA|nr:expressed unknown protein [Seminavis robusta]|eukprot:Sro5_g004390.1 n/a (405) ;mRNA; f:142948-144420
MENITAEHLHTIQDHPNNNELEDARYIPIVVLGSLSSSLSLIGSACIVYMSCHELKHIKQRLLLSLSLADMVSSMACLLMPFAVPSFLGLPGAIGNHASCTTVGFFHLFTFKLGAFYNTYLSLYFLLLVRWNWKEHNFSKTAEAVAHIIAVAIPLSIDVAAAATQSLNPLPGLANACAYSTYPVDCGDEQDCQRSTLQTILVLHRVAGSVVLLISILGFGATGMVWFTARKQFQTSRKYRFDRSDSSLTKPATTSSRTGNAKSSSSMDANDKYIRQVGVQAVLYSLEQLGQRDFYGIQILFWILFPLQGAFNFFVYTRLSVQRWRRVHPEASIFWIYGQILTCAVLPNHNRGSTVHRNTSRRDVRLSPQKALEQQRSTGREEDGSSLQQPAASSNPPEQKVESP